MRKSKAGWIGSLVRDGDGTVDRWAAFSIAMCILNLLTCAILSGYAVTSMKAEQQDILLPLLAVFAAGSAMVLVHHVRNRGENG